MTTLVRPIPAVDVGAVRDELERYVRRSYGSLLRTAMRVLKHVDDAEEAVQEGLLAATRALHQYNGLAKVSTWTHTIVRNASFLKWRRLRGLEPGQDDVLRRGADEDPLDVEGPAADPSARLDREETCRRVRDALEVLPVDQARLIRWRHLDGMSYDEIADRSGIGVGAARVRVHRALSALRALVESGSPASRRPSSCA